MTDDLPDNYSDWLRRKSRLFARGLIFTFAAAGFLWVNFETEHIYQTHITIVFGFLFFYGVMNFLLYQQLQCPRCQTRLFVGMAGSMRLFAGECQKCQLPIR